MSTVSIDFEVSEINNVRPKIDELPPTSWDVDESGWRRRFESDTSHSFDADGLVVRGDGVELITGVRSTGPAQSDHLVPSPWKALGAGCKSSGPYPN